MVILNKYLKIDDKKYKVIKDNPFEIGYTLMNMEFTYLYVKRTNRIHDSGYKIMEVYGYDKKYKDSVFLLSEICDVIDFKLPQDEIKHAMVSIDIFENNIVRYFIKGKDLKFKLYSFPFCSSIMLDIV